MLADPILKFFAQYIEAELGIIYSDHNYYQLQNRLEEIATLFEFENVEPLYELAKNGISGRLKNVLLDTATNNETSFFRDPNVFKAFEKVALPQILAHTPEGKEIKIWSAACSTGQEPLSLAIMLREWSELNHRPLDFHITGTDISERALIRARSASFTELEVQRGLPANLLTKYFKKDERDTWTASSQLTDRISFESLNLKDPYPFTQLFDFVFCRNVLIYQSVEGKKAILAKVTKALRPDGYLVMGAGESVLGLSSDYGRAPVDSSVIYMKKIDTAKVA